MLFFLNEVNQKRLRLYHGSEKNQIEINNKNIWLTDDIEYANIWGKNIFEVNIKLNNILDTYNDLGKKKYTLKQIAKYLEKNKVNTDDFKYVMRNYLDDEKYLFWELISKHPSISYMWLTSDIFNSGYDAIAVFEYAYTRNNKAKTYLINKPADKILSIKKYK